MRIAVFGTPLFAARIFEKIREEAPVEIISAVTTPDAFAGRGKNLQQPPVKMWAEKHSIPVLQPHKPDIALAQQLQKEADILIVIAYGKLFSESFLSVAPMAWNLHLSILPKYRGTSPVPAAILAGEKESGVSVFRIGVGMDDGPVLGIKRFSIANLRADAVYDQIVVSGAELLLELLRQKASGNHIIEQTQTHDDASYCRKIEKEDGLVVPHEEPAETALSKIRAYYPWPSAWIMKDGKRIKLLDAAQSEQKAPAGEFVYENKRLYLGFPDAAIEILEIQPEGKRVMSGVEFGISIRSKTAG